MAPVIESNKNFNQEALAFRFFLTVLMMIFEKLSIVSSALFRACEETPRRPFMLYNIWND